MKRRMGLVAGILLAGCMYARAADVYWTGNAGNGLWSDTNNWHGFELPGQEDVVRLAYSAYKITNAHETIYLDIDATVQQVVFAGEGERSVNLVSTDQQTLGIVEQHLGISMLADAVADLEINTAVVLQVLGPTTQRSINNSSLNATLIIGPDAVFKPSTTATPTSFQLQLRGRGYRLLSTQPTSSILRFSGGDTRAVADLNGGAVAGGTFQAYGVLLLASDASAGTGGVSMRNGGLDVGIVETNEDIRFTIGLLQNYSAETGYRVRVLDSPDNSPGHLTLVVGNWSSKTNSPWIETTALSTVELSSGIPYAEVHGVTNPGITGAGNLLLKGTAPATVYTFARHMTYTGRTMLETGIMSLTASGSLPEGTIVEIGGSAALRVNHERTVGGVSGYNGTDGTLDLNGGALTVNATQASAFGGTIAGTGALVKAGAETWSLTAGYTNTAGRTLRVEGGILAVTGALSVEAGTFELAGGRITAGSLASEDTVWDVTLHEVNEGQMLVTVGENADITGATLNLFLAGGYSPEYGKEYTLLYAGSISGAVQGGQLFGWEEGVPFEQNGQEYILRWEEGSDQIILTAIPEPGSLLLLALAVAGLLALRRRRG